MNEVLNGSDNSVNQNNSEVAISNSTINLTSTYKKPYVSEIDSATVASRLNCESSSISFRNETTSNLQPEDIYWCAKNIKNQKSNEYKEFCDKMSSLLDENPENSVTTDAEIYFCNLLNSENYYEYLVFLQDFYTENASNLKIVLGIMHMISHIDYDVVGSIGLMIIRGAISRFDNLRIRAYFVKAIDNWNSSNAVSYLAEEDFKEKWLKRYIEKIHFRFQSAS